MTKQKTATTSAEVSYALPFDQNIYPAPLFIPQNTESLELAETMLTKTSDTSKQAAAANASRLRDNQRRSRARKKEYLATLEAKYQECQRLGVEASIEIQNAARAVVKENQRLKDLLRKTGFVDEEIDRWIREGGLEMGASERVQNGLGRRPCPPDLCDSNSRPDGLSRRCSTGGIMAKTQTSILPSQRRASCMPDNSGMISPTQAQPAMIAPTQTCGVRRTQSLHVRTGTQLQGFNSNYPTPSSTATPTSTTSSSPFSQASALPLGRGTMNSTYSSPPGSQMAVTSAGGFTAITSNTTSPPILAGNINNWNNFQLQQQLPSPALPPNMHTFMQAQQQQQMLQPRTVQNLQQSQQQQQFQYANSSPEQQQQSSISRTACNIAANLISQFQPEGLTSELQEELCPTNTMTNTNSYPYQQQQQQQQQQQGQSRQQCCDGLVDCGPDDDGDHDEDGGSVHLSDGGNGMGLQGNVRVEMEMGSQGNMGMGCGQNMGASGCGEDTGMSACSVDNALLFGVLNRIAG